MTDRRFRIVQIADIGNYGGAERALQWFAGAADRKRFDYHFVFIYRDGPIADAIADMGYPVEVLHWRDGRSVTGRWRLARLLRRLQPDLIHDHGSTPLGRATMRLAIACPIVSTDHGVIVAEYPPGQVKLALSRFDDRLTTVVIANSNFTAQAHARVYRRPMSAIRTVYLGLNLERFADCHRNHDRQIGSEGLSGTTRIAFAGRLEVFKGVLELPRLAHALLRRGFEDFEILVAGDGPAKQPCLQLSRELGVLQHMRFLGWQADMLAIFQKAHIFIFPSLWDEPFGLAPLEALAAGLPVVGYRVGGSPEALEGAPDTWLVPKGQTDELADAVITAISRLPQHDPTAGLAYVRARFDVQQTARNVETIYEELLGEQKQYVEPAAHHNVNIVGDGDGLP